MHGPVLLAVFKVVWADRYLHGGQQWLGRDSSVRLFLKKEHRFLQQDKSRDHLLESQGWGVCLFHQNLGDGVERSVIVKVVGV